MQRLLAASAVLGALLTGCGDAGEDAAATTSPTPTNAPPVDTSLLIPTISISSEGWGATPPDKAAMGKMFAWMTVGGGRDMKQALADMGRAIKGLPQALRDQDSATVIAMCNSVSEPLTDRLPAGAQTPDADLTSALNALVQDGAALQKTCDTLEGLTAKAQEDALKAPLLQIVDDGRLAQMILERDFGIFREFESEFERARVAEGGG